MTVYELIGELVGFPPDSLVYVRGTNKKVVDAESVKDGFGWAHKGHVYIEIDEPVGEPDEQD